MWRTKLTCVYPRHALQWNPTSSKQLPGIRNIWLAPHKVSSHENAYLSALYIRHPSPADAVAFLTDGLQLRQTPVLARWSAAGVQYAVGNASSEYGQQTSSFSDMPSVSNSQFTLCFQHQSDANAPLHVPIVLGVENVEATIEHLQATKLGTCIAAPAPSRNGSVITSIVEDPCGYRYQLLSQHHAACILSYRNFANSPRRTLDYYTSILQMRVLSHFEDDTDDTARWYPTASSEDPTKPTPDPIVSRGDKLESDAFSSFTGIREKQENDQEHSEQNKSQRYEAHDLGYYMQPDAPVYTVLGPRLRDQHDMIQEHIKRQQNPQLDVIGPMEIVLGADALTDVIENFHDQLIPVEFAIRSGWDGRSSHLTNETEGIDSSWKKYFAEDHEAQSVDLFVSTDPDGRDVVVVSPHADDQYELHTQKRASKNESGSLLRRLSHWVGFTGRSS